MVCPHCSQDHPSGLEVCPVTGKSLRGGQTERIGPEIPSSSGTFECRFCGMEHPLAANFCPLTGMPLESPSDKESAKPSPIISTSESGKLVQPGAGFRIQDYYPAEEMEYIQTDIPLPPSSEATPPALPQSSSVAGEIAAAVVAGKGAATGETLAASGSAGSSAVKPTPVAHSRREQKGKVKVVSRSCSRCQAIVQPGELFCSNCGLAMSEDVELMAARRKPASWAWFIGPATILLILICLLFSLAYGYYLKRNQSTPTASLTATTSQAVATLTLTPLPASPTIPQTASPSSTPTFVLGVP